MTSKRRSAGGACGGGGGGGGGEAKVPPDRASVEAVGLRRSHRPGSGPAATATAEAPAEAEAEATADRREVVRAGGARFFPVPPLRQQARRDRDSGRLRLQETALGNVVVSRCHAAAAAARVRRENPRAPPVVERTHRRAHRTATALLRHSRRVPSAGHRLPPRRPPPFAMAALRFLTVLSVVLGMTLGQHFLGSGRQHAPNRFNFFDIELLKEVIRQEGAHNFVISPASAKAVKHPGTAVEIANQIFVSPEITVNHLYQEALTNIYLSGTQNVEFTNPQLAASTINGWVLKNTHGLIRTLVAPQAMNPQTKALVANALYFRGRWAVPFDKRATTVRCFYPIPSVCKNANFMETVGQHSFANLRDLNAKALEISYQGSKFSMLFLLPNNDIDELLRDLSYQPLNTIIPKLESTTVVVSIPRFAIEFDVDLTASLTNLGIKDLFTPAANLSGMVQKGENVFINKVFQKVVLEIDEEGTVGAAASGAVAVPLQGPTLPRFQASRPFLFFVRDIETGNYLFAGFVEQPELATEPLNSNPPQPNFSTVLKPVSINPVESKIDETTHSNGSPNRRPGDGSDTIRYPV
ncbi:Serpin B8 [Gryllus bimaculatus]|nr:Serpin B8 [Gryllus bimaculatus]